MSATAVDEPTVGDPVVGKRARRLPRPALRSARPQRQRPTRQVREIRAGEAEEVLSIASSAFAILALVCGWMLLQTLFLGHASEARSQHLLYSQLRQELALATAPTGALDFENKPVQPGDPVALLSIPKLGLSEVVVDGTASGDLFHGPGHLRNTPLPGQAGTSVVMGRAATYGAPFRHITSLQPGAEIVVQNGQAKVIYRVKDVRRAGDPLPAAPTGATAGQLTLVTAEGSGGLGALRPHQVVYVDATTDEAVPAGPIASAVPPAELAMGRDTAALPVLAVVLAGLAALVLAVSVARRRFPAVLVWVLATPVAIAFAWAVTDQVMRLLPNLM
jgi:sortase A